VEARLRLGRLVQVHRSVYAALLSHRSAATSLQLLRSTSGRIEVTAPRARKPHPAITVHRSRLIDPDDRAAIDGIPTTSVARTLVDLADVLSQGRLADAGNEAEVQRLFDLAALEATLERLRGRRGRHRLLRVLVAYRYDPAFSRSRAERRFLDLCLEHGLPRPSTCISIAGHEVDAYWADARLAIEFDGEAFHRTRRAFHEDRRRDRRLATLGIQVNRVTWPDLHEGAGLGAELKAIIAQRLRMPHAAS
jgi:hypothetical protein